MARQVLVDLNESISVVTARVKGSLQVGELADTGVTLEFRGLKEVEISREGQVPQTVSPGLFFETLRKESRVVDSVSIVKSDRDEILALGLDSARFEYLCCGEDSSLLLALPNYVPVEVGDDVVLEVVFRSTACQYDRPKVFCNFGSALTGGPFVIDGGVLLLTNFAGLNLQDAVIVNTDLRGSSFAGADLRGALFKNVDLREVDFTGALVDQTIFRQVKSDTMLGRP
jgi:hypothetical protein